MSLKKMQKHHLTNSKTIVIKAMNLVLSLYQLWCLCFVMVRLNLIIFCNKMNYIYHNQSFVVPNNLNHNEKISFKLGTFYCTWINGRIWKHIPFMIHLECMEIIDYLHLFDSSGLIAKLSISQGSIPCNFCPFYIR